MSTPARQPTAAAPQGALISWWRRSAAQMRQRPGLTSLVLLVLLAVALVAAYFARQQYQARRDWEEAQRLIADYQFREARPHLEACFAVWKQSGETAFVLARTCRRADDIPAAQKYLKEAERLGWPEDQLSFEYTLIRLQQEGATSTDETFVQRYLEKRSPEEVLVLEALCTGLDRASQHGVTEKFLQHWVSHYPGEWAPRFWRGSFYLRMVNMQLAQADLEKVLELKPDHSEAQRLLVQVLLRNRHPRQALELAEQYLQKHPDEVDTLVALGKCQREVRQFEAAQATLHRALDKHKDHAGALLVLAQIEADQDNARGALRWLRELERVVVNDNEEINTAAALRVRVFRDLDMDQEAEVAQRRLEQLKDDLKRVNDLMDELKKRAPTLEDRLTLGGLYLRMGLERQGVDTLTRVIEDFPNEKRPHRMLLEQYEKKEDSESRRRAEIHRQYLKRLGA